MDFSNLDALLQSSLNIAFPAAQLIIYQHGKIIYERNVGYPDPESPAQPITHNTRFDLASVSQLFTVATFMRLVEEGRTRLDQPVCEVLPTFTGTRLIQPQPDPLGSGNMIEVVSPTNDTADASRVTFRHLLTHTSGLPAWLPLWKVGLGLQTDGVPNAAIQQRLHEMALQTAFAYPTGARVVYSDVGLILIGLAIEQLSKLSLDAAVHERITQPLALSSIGYGPIPCDEAAPTEFYAHQGKRMCGEVHDENAFALNGVAGHAGLFGTARDVAAFGEALRTALAGTSNEPLLQQATLRETTRLQAQDGDVRRGIGFALWSPNPRAMSHALRPSAFGHLGFTGTSLWVDPQRELTFACLTNHIYYGREGEDTMTPFRVALSQSLKPL
jgi:serine-type D-Ala-D-Ala carboxypeptidase